MNYVACIKASCGSYATELNNNKLFKSHCPRNFLDNKTRKYNTMLATVSL